MGLGSIMDFLNFLDIRVLAEILAVAIFVVLCCAVVILYAGKPTFTVNDAKLPPLDVRPGDKIIFSWKVKSALNQEEVWNIGRPCPKCKSDGLPIMLLKEDNLSKCRLQCIKCGFIGSSESGP